MNIDSNAISKSAVDALINKSIFDVVKANMDGFKKFAAKHISEVPIFSAVLNYISDIDFDSFNSINLMAALRNAKISEGTLSDLFNNIDYLRSVNKDKDINSDTISLLKDIFYSGHYEYIEGRSYAEIFEYCRDIRFITNYRDPRFVIQDISTPLDLKSIVSLLSPGTSIKSSFDFINDSSPNKGYFPNELVTISAAPGVGKTQFCMTEALNFVRQGKRVLYIAMGDMIDYKIIIRLMCMYNRITPDEAYMNLEKYITEFQLNKDLVDKFKFVILKSNTVTSDEVFNFLSVMHESYDIYMIDYDGNFAKRSDSMYTEGGNTYDDAINLSREYTKLGFILSQPKIGYWTNEALGMECLAESSRKQQITDTIITFGRRQGVHNRCGLAQIVKRRDGDLVFRQPWAAAESGQSIQIDDDMYGELCSSDKFLKLQVNEYGTLDLPDKFLDEGIEPF